MKTAFALLALTLAGCQSWTSVDRSYGVQYDMTNRTGYLTLKFTGNPENKGRASVEATISGGKAVIPLGK
ncbi:hypothetical protein TSACC_21719 [Terrimicrobium sacchariphilum]|uniref:Lipoprotein n=1 Tax=Terrimicrobium sacchariphilum TaxID=690879 RepID=A0A146G9N5_TERSA|nr:hypothetical protein [Terrimicrobium sacchariphilum]GAT33306.1 hypothetical protein TSACC_21719 [Terrimicrobium sacchariphilum]